MKYSGDRVINTWIQWIQRLSKTLPDPIIKDISTLSPFEGFIRFKNPYRRTSFHSKDLIQEFKTAAAFLFVSYLVFYNLRVHRIHKKLSSESLGDLNKEREIHFDTIISENCNSKFQQTFMKVYPEGIRIPPAVLKEFNEDIYQLEYLLSQDIIGKVFSSLLPLDLRKYASIYFTKIPAARLLVLLSITHPTDRVLDLACGSGILIFEAVKRLESLGNRNPIELIYGNDISQIAVHLSEMNLSLFQEKKLPPKHLCMNDGFDLTPESFGISYSDVILMNPPFTRHERIDTEYLAQITQTLSTAGYATYLHGKMSLQHYFFFQADRFLHSTGRLAFVIPANTFAADISFGLLKFFLDYRYHLQYVIMVDSPKGTFSEDCNFKEWLMIAQKGTLSSGALTKFIKLSELPIYETAENIAKICQDADKSGTFHSSGIKIQVSIYPAEYVYENNKWDRLFWRLPDPFLEQIFNPNLMVPLKESPEFRFHTGFHSTYCDYLIFPNRWFTIENSPSSKVENTNSRTLKTKQSNAMILRRLSDGNLISIPAQFFVPCLREPKLHQHFVENPYHFVLAISRNTPIPIELKREILDVLTASLQIELEKKIRSGGKIRSYLEPDWYYHPIDTGAFRKQSQLFTFNRYGIWLRNNLAIWTPSPITANDGFHLYECTNLTEDRVSIRQLTILHAWFNSSLHLYDFLCNCRVPAPHVQQVLKPDRELMRVPIISHITSEQQNEILVAIETMNNESPSKIKDQFNKSSRRTLDSIWLRILHFSSEQIPQLLDHLYSRLTELIDQR